MAEPSAIINICNRKMGARQAGGAKVLSEYDFSCSRPNKYGFRYAKSSLAVSLDPDVTAVFPRVWEANDALLVLAGVIRG